MYIVGYSVTVCDGSPQSPECGGRGILTELCLCYSIVYHYLWAPLCSRSSWCYIYI